MLMPGTVADRWLFTIGYWCSEKIRNLSIKKVNKYLQYIVFLSALVLSVGGIFNSDLWDLLFWSVIPIGATHYLGAFIDFVLTEKRSIYRYHLSISTIILVVMGLATNSCLNQLTNYKTQDFAVILGGLGSLVLAIYFW